LLALAAACSKSSVRPAPSPSPASPAASVPAGSASASAIIRDAAGNRVGSATFTDSYAGVIVAGMVSGLGLGAHGVHIHSVGKCEPPFTSAGGHFNPEARQHGYRNPNGPHLGDLPNIVTPPAGPLQFEFLLPGATLTGRHALLDADGSSIVIHGSRDDFATDPAGNSGARIACGVLTR
jgi:Cu-Zn family superoxide dismutase